ncbi:MAG: DNA cytosine methyltransferase [Bryobacterales bacterium]|nr:DNA cytosine methyltransferase [Bryobacterales bacterium]
MAALTRRGLDTVLCDLAALGYDADWHCIPASSVGAPHRRDRISILAYPNGRGCQQDGFGRGLEEVDRGEIDNQLSTSQLCSDVADASGAGLAQRESESGNDGAQQPPAFGTGWWAVEPDLGRVAHGIPLGWTALIERLGNGVVPQVAQAIGQAISAAERAP